MTTESKFPTLEFIKSEQLREIIQTKEVGKDYLIIDVRDDDYVGGNIPNCINKPSATIKDSLDSLISDYSHEVVDQIAQKRIKMEYYRKKITPLKKFKYYQVVSLNGKNIIKMSKL
ncbi:16385_t:CDS:2 [Funneliformis geosporum]|nr:16385_t:CDS:2 [Funneliformis geosporum]